MTDCKHDWHFVDGTSDLKCRRCGEDTGPRTYEERVQDILEYDTTQFYMPTGQLQIAKFKPNYTLTFHRDGKEIGKFDYNGPEMLFEGDAAESAKVFIDCVANAFHGRLEEEREAGRQEALAQEPVAYLCENAAGHKYFRWKKPSGMYKPIALYTKEKNT